MGLSHSHIGNDAIPSTSPETISDTPSPSPLPTDNRKQILLELVFRGIDDDDSKSIDREEIMQWISNVPYLRLSKWKKDVDHMLLLLNHDEDSLVSLVEFGLAFRNIPFEEVRRLVINLLRTIPIHQNGLECQLHRIPTTDNRTSDSAVTSPTSATPAEPSSASTSDLSDAGPSIVAEGVTVKTDWDEKMFLLDILFHAIDTDSDHRIGEEEFSRFILSDRFITKDSQICKSSMELFKILQPANQQPRLERRASEPSLYFNSSSSTTHEITRPRTLTPEQFFQCFSSMDLDHIQNLLVHLLSQNTQSTIINTHVGPRRLNAAAHQINHRAFLAVSKRYVPLHQPSRMRLIDGRNLGKHDANALLSPDAYEQVVDWIKHEPTNLSTTAPAELALHPSLIRSPPPRINTATAFLKPDHGGGSSLRITVLGQSMIQHDLRQSMRGRELFTSLPQYLSADVIFTELETAILGKNAGPPTRNTVFFHAAKAEVIDCLSMLRVNLLGLANNHAGDLGPSGVLDIIQEVSARNITFAGVGSNLEEASDPAYIDVAAGKRRNSIVGKFSSADHPFSLDGSKSRSDDMQGGSQPSSPFATSEHSTYPYNHTTLSKLATPPTSPYIRARQLPPPRPLSTRVALVAVASKVPPGSEATEDQPGVNSMTMEDVSIGRLREADVERVLHSISAARHKAQIVFLYHHNHYFSAAVNKASIMGAWKREFAHACIDSGASMYVGHGDPRLQGIEIYKGCPIFFCLGNFVFQTKTEIGFYGSEVWESVIVRIEYHKEDDIEDITETAELDSSPEEEVSSDEEEIENKMRPQAEMTAPAPSPSFSIQLLPIVMNEQGDGEGVEHLQTRGIPALASKERGLQILKRLQTMSAEFNTVIHIQECVEEDIERAVGWVLSKPRVKPKAKVLSTTPCSPETVTLHMPPLTRTESVPDALPSHSDLHF